MVSNEINALKSLDKYTVAELVKKEKELAALREEIEKNFKEWNTILACLKRFSEVTTGYTDSTFEVKSLQSEQRGTE